MKTEITIRNCRIKVNCPKDWNGLRLSDKDGIRYCDSCNNDVYFCKSDEETIAHARLGNCIAREIPLRDELPVIFVGKVIAQPEETEDQRQALIWTQRENGINEVLKLNNPTKHCYSCGYPTSEWRKTCKVCGAVFNDAKSTKA